jgi:methylated-DNA-[protein]-cysteine S-methyltransferase
MLDIAYWTSPLGQIKLEASQEALTSVQFEEGEVNFSAKGSSSTLLIEAMAQLEAYFQKRLQVFSLPLHLVGTSFQKEVYQQVAAIPYGSTRTYGQLAAQMQNPGAVRAVGAANGKNPLLIVVPCHRVVGPAGKLTGYAGGLERKEKLLRLEGVIPENRQMLIEW